MSKNKKLGIMLIAAAAFIAIFVAVTNDSTTLPKQQENMLYE